MDKKAISLIRKAGFGYLKVELEGQMNRPESACLEDCANCDGEGEVECDACNGYGYTEDDENERCVCSECDGEGDVGCTNCDGEGEVNTEESRFYDTDACQERILDQLPSAARDAIIFSKFYYDGSVDSELTFTVRLEDCEYIPSVIEAFRALSDEIGNGLDTSGAGMHIGLLPIESEGRYPYDGERFNRERLANFTTQCELLMPALLCAAMSDSNSRSLHYRTPRVSREKYSAIHVMDGTCIEYRLFETCFDNSRAVFDYLKTISETLKFYINPGKKVKTSGKTLEYLSGDGIKTFLRTAEDVKTVKGQLRYILGGRKISEFFRARGLRLDGRAYRKNDRLMRKQALNLCKLEEEAADEAMSEKLSPYEKARVREIIESHGVSMKRAIMLIRSVEAPESFEDKLARTYREGREIVFKGGV